MKVSIEGFNQQVALGFVKEVPYKDKTKTIRLDCTDLVVLRWFVDFYPNMKKIEIDGKQYAWLTHSKIEEDLPILNISKKAYIDRLHKLVEFDILTYKFIKEGGSFSVYGFGSEYEKLVHHSRGVDGQPTTGGVWSTDYPVYGQPTTKDKTIIDKTIKSNIKKNNKKKVTPPTLEEIQEYIAEKNYEVDAQTFFDYYDSADWHDAKGNPVKCWKQRLATWNSRKEKNGSVRTGSYRASKPIDLSYVNSIGEADEGTFA